MLVRDHDSVFLRQGRRIWASDERPLSVARQILHCAAFRSEPALSVPKG